MNVSMNLSIDLKGAEISPSFVKEKEFGKVLVDVLSQAGEPLETKEVVEKLRGVTRTKVLYRLMILRGDGVVRGKAVGSGKGVWIWWLP